MRSDDGLPKTTRETEGEELVLLGLRFDGFPEHFSRLVEARHPPMDAMMDGLHLWRVDVASRAPQTVIEVDFNGFNAGCAWDCAGQALEI